MLAKFLSRACGKKHTNLAINRPQVAKLSVVITKIYYRAWNHL